MVLVLREQRLMLGDVGGDGDVEAEEELEGLGAGVIEELLHGTEGPVYVLFCVVCVGVYGADL